MVSTSTRSPRKPKTSATPKAPGLYHHGDLPRALAVAARQLLEECGLAQVSLRSACERLGVSVAAPYRHYSKREDLLAAVLTTAFEELEHSTLQVWQGQRAPTDALVNLGVAYVQFAQANPNTYRAMFGAVLDKQAYPNLQAAGLRALGVLQHAVHAWLVSTRPQASAQRNADEAAFSLLAWSMAHGISTLALDGVLPVTQASLEERAQALFARVVGALEADHKAP